MEKFITIEGNDGSGKSTVIEGLKRIFCERGIDVVFTREPGGSMIAEKIRQIILDPENTQMDDKTEALLYAASRRQHLTETVLPALNSGKMVICDRFIDSSLAYQGYARNIGVDEVLKINEFAIEGHMPDTTIFLDVLPEVGLSRISTRTFKDRLDQENIDFHQRVFDGYMLVNERFGQDIVKFDANRTPEEIINDITAYIEKLVK